LPASRSTVRRRPQTLAQPVAAVFVVAVVWLLVRGGREVRCWLLAMLLLAAGTYGMVALGRAFFFSGDRLAIGISKRWYHYVGTIPLAVVLCLVLARAGAWRPAHRVGPVLLWSWVVATLGLRALSADFIDRHAEARTETQHVIDSIRADVAAAPPGTTVRIPYHKFLATGPMIAKAPVAFPGWAAIFAITFPDNTVDGRQVRFLASPEVCRGNRRWAPHRRAHGGGVAVLMMWLRAYAGLCFSGPRARRRT
jgi:hypothetical protein